MLLDNGTRRSWSDFLISACLFVFFFEAQLHEFSYRFCDDKTQDETQSEDGHDESLFKSEFSDFALNPAGTSLVEALMMLAVSGGMFILCLFSFIAMVTQQLPVATAPCCSTTKAFLEANLTTLQPS